MRNPLATKLQLIANQATKNCLFVRWEYTRETNPTRQTKLLILFNQFQSRVDHVQEMIYRLEFGNSWYDKVTESKNKLPKPAYNYSDYVKELVIKSRQVVDTLMNKSRSEIPLFIS